MIADWLLRALESLRTQPVLLFLAGPNGAGKSRFFEAFVKPALGDRLPFVNADNIAKAIREATPAASQDDVDQLAFAKTEELRRSLFEQRLSFCTETVFSDPVGVKLGFLRDARIAGYAVFLVYIGLSDAQLSLARVVQRESEGGHGVDEKKLPERFLRSLANLHASIAIVNEAFLFDNSSDDAPFRLVAIYADGKLIQGFGLLPPWAEGLPSL